MKVFAKVKGLINTAVARILFLFSFKLILCIHDKMIWILSKTQRFHEKSISSLLLSYVCLDCLNQWICAKVDFLTLYCDESFKRNIYTKETFLHVLLLKQRTNIYVKTWTTCCSNSCLRVIIVQSKLWNTTTFRTLFDKNNGRKTFYFPWKFIKYVYHVCYM